MKAAIYARVSTTKPRQEHGLQAQIRACRRFLEDRVPEIDRDVRVYTEQASGRKDTSRRGRLREVLADAAMKRFRVLVVFRFDRLSRRQGLQLGDVVDVVKQLHAHGVRVYSVSETWWDPDGPIAPLVLEALSWAASMESRAIADRVRSGVAARREEARLLNRQFLWGRARTSSTTLRCAKCNRPARRERRRVVHLDGWAADKCAWGVDVRETIGDPELPKRIAQLRGRGRSWSQIANEAGVGRTTARRLYRIAVPERRPPPKGRGALRGVPTR